MLPSVLVTSTSYVAPFSLSSSVWLTLPPPVLASAACSALAFASPVIAFDVSPFSESPEDCAREGGSAERECGERCDGDEELLELGSHAEQARSRR